MADVRLGLSQEEVTSAINNMQWSINWMLTETTWTHERADEVSRLSQRDIDMALCLDPAKIAEEFDRVRRIAMAVGEEAELVVKLRDAYQHTSGWKGDAADAFRDHMTRMEVFATQAQHNALLIGLRDMGALFSMAYHMRQSYHDLAILVRAAAEHEIDEHRERVEKVQLAIGKEFVKAALSINPAAMATAVADFAVESIGVLGDYWIEGTGTDAVINSYVQGSDKLWHTFEDELRRLADHIRGEHRNQDNANAEMKVLQSINQVSNGITDVGSPNFSYANFYTEEYPKDGPFAGKVAEERPGYAEEKRHRDSEINRRLENR